MSGAASAAALATGRKHIYGVRPPRAWMLILPVDALAIVAVVPLHLNHARALLTMAVVSVALFAGAGLYRPRLHLSLLDDVPALVARLLIAVFFVAAVTVFRHDFDSVDSLLTAVAFAVPLVVAGRLVTYLFIRAARRARWRTGHRAVIVGSGPVTAGLVQALTRERSYGLDVVGRLDEPGNIYLSGVKWLGDVTDLAGVLTRHQADVVIVADARTSEDRFAEILEASIGRTYDVLVVPRMRRFPTRSARQDHIGAIPIQRVRLPVLEGWRWRLKRSVDILVSAFALAVLSPVLLCCALAVRLEGGPGVLFRQIRVGRNGRTFEVLKFRSMRPRDDNDSQTTWSIAQDDRVGPVGKVLRRTSLDELPQLWNILRGDMTIVGPRPERPHFVEQFSAVHPHYARRHRVPVGLTGLAQVSGLRGDTPISDRARFDNYYIENWSLWLDVKIVVRTLNEIFSAGGR
uniref:sugar transferase n=1 Tax=Paractinoplanes polyasparticus TaxID=2856853 RepID=UPI0027DF9A86|nr:sugar transferase [Actinoplanes polyasparticus]